MNFMVIGHILQFVKCSFYVTHRKDSAKDSTLMIGIQIATQPIKGRIDYCLRQS